MLGKDARQVLDLGDNHQATLAMLCQILEPETDPDGPLCLVADMGPARLDLGLELLTAFHAGLIGKPNP